MYEGDATYHRLKSKKAKEFVQSLVICGSVFFLSFPFWVVFNLFTSKFSRHRYMVLGTCFCQGLTLVALSYQITGKGAGFYKVSYRGRSILPVNAED